MIVATGCYVDSALAKDEQDESVDLFVPNDQKNAIVTLVKQAWRKIWRMRYKAKMEFP